MTSAGTDVGVEGNGFPVREDIVTVANALGIDLPGRKRVRLIESPVDWAQAIFELMMDEGPVTDYVESGIK